VTELILHGIPESGTDPAEAAVVLDEYLRDLAEVEPVSVEVEQPRLGPAEILAIIELANNAIDLAQKLAAFIKSHHDKGDAKLKEIEIEIDGRRVRVGSLTPDQQRRLTAAIAEGS
jgi:hypothetical protein